MTRYTFPAGVFPELLSLGGTTYCGYGESGRGLVMRRWPDGRPDLFTELWVDPTASSKGGYLRLAVDDTGLPLALYYRESPTPGHVAVSHVDRVDPDHHPLPAAPWRIPFNGNNPAGWSLSSPLRVAVQDLSQFALTALWPNTPSSVGLGSRPGNAMGISRFDTALQTPVHLWTEDDPFTANQFAIRNPQWLADGTIIGDGQNGGVGVVLNGIARFLDYGETRNTPRGCRQANGRLSVGWWNRDGRSVEVACDISEADLWEMPDIARFASPKFVGVFWGSSEQYGYDPYSGNLETLFGAYAGWPASDYRQMAVPGRSVIGSGARNVPEEKNLGAFCGDLASDLAAQGRRWRYTDSRVFEDRVPPLASDVRMFQAYPLKGETPLAFEISLQTQLARFSGQKVLVPKFYEGNPPQQFTEAELDPFFPVYERLMRRPDILGLVAFNGSREASDGSNAGIKRHPRWRMWLDAFAIAAGPALPVLIPVVTPPQPPPAKKGSGGPVYEYLFTA